MRKNRRTEVVTTLVAMAAMVAVAAPAVGADRAMLCEYFNATW
jgi:hypothetical protein